MVIYHIKIFVKCRLCARHNAILWRYSSGKRNKDPAYLTLIFHRKKTKQVQKHITSCFCKHREEDKPDRVLKECLPTEMRYYQIEI